MSFIRYPILVISVIVCHFSPVSSSAETVVESDQIFSVKFCRSKAKSIQDLESYNAFAKYMSQYVQNDEIIDSKINRCLHSSNGLEDLKTLSEIVDQLPRIHSVCEPDFINRLLEFDSQMKEHVSYGKIFKRKQTHRFLYFFRMFAGQVVLTCKTSLENKLIMAETENNELSGAIERINGILNNNELSREKKANAALESTNLPPMFALALKLKPNTFKQVENLVLADANMNSLEGVEFSLDVTLNSEQALENFIKTKQACKLIDVYGQSSIYPITRLAWRGYMARNENGQIDKQLRNSEKVQEWIKVVQYCQGILVTKAYLDIEQEIPVKFEHELANDQQFITLDVVKQKELCLSQKSLPDSSGGCTSEWHRFEPVRETFDKFDKSLSGYTFPNGLSGWLTKRLGHSERMISSYIRLKLINGDHYHNDEDSQQNVQFGGASGMAHGISAGGHAAFAGHAVIHKGAFRYRPTGGKGGKTAAQHHHYYIFFGAHLPAWEYWLIIVGLILTLTILAAFLKSWLGTDVD